jgi:hypothetical protein
LEEEPMIDANAPAAAAAPFDTLAAQLGAFFAAARSAAAGGLTWQEFGELLVSLLRMCVTTLDTVDGLTRDEKRAVVLAAAASLFDLVADKAIPVVAWPFWLIIRPAVRSLVLAIAAGAMEQILKLVRS